MNKLIIDTTDNKKTTVKLETNNSINEITEDSIPKSQITLQIIDKLLKQNSLKPTEIDEIEVNTGPGSFTGLRVGITIATTLGKLLSIPVNGHLEGDITPQYI